MNRKTHQFWIAVVLGLLVAGSASASVGHTGFGQFFTDYESIRLALVNDTLEEVDAHATVLAKRSDELLEHFSAESGGVPEEKSEELKTALRELAQAASALAAAPDISSAREALFELTKPMVQFRNLTADESTLVAYCPMAKKSWMQVPGELGNPYLGQKMPTCGEVVSD